MGRRELSQLSPFELVVLIVLGDVVQQAVTQEDMSITGGVLAAGTMIALTVALSWITFRSPTAEAALDGLPLLIYRDGKLDPKIIQAERLTRDNILDAARREGISDLEDVDYAVLEPTGAFTFIQKR
jgi:uncharacterized membrane protein YcaP (DUF421 family)